MFQLEHALSPIIKKRSLISKTTSQKDLFLIEQIKQQKIQVVNKLITPAQANLVRPEIVESWIRCYNYGLDLFDYNYGPILEKEVFQEHLKQKELLVKAANPYILQLEKILSDYECIILLTDENGVMLRVVEGMHQLLKEQNARFKLVEGSVWTEQTVGTCAHGLSLIHGTPMQICGPEHYGETYDEISCSSSPIYDANFNLAGTLSIVSPSFYHQSSHSLGLVVSMAWAVQKDFQIALKKEILNLPMKDSDEAVITINKKGIITQTNYVANSILSNGNNQLLGIHIDTIFDIETPILATGQPILNAYLEVKNSSQRLLISNVETISDSNNNNLGWILVLKRLNKSKKYNNQSNNLNAEFTFKNIIGKSQKLIDSINIAKKFALLDTNIVIEGESGTGKEMYAQAIHNENRPDGPFIAINCAAIPKTLIESELFGYEGGSFTGAERQGRPGKIEMANGGTLFLDEIGDMPLELQAVLLRVLEEKKVVRVGGNKYIPVNFRLITASNKNLLDLIKKGNFREDLYYRLKVLKINIPPLRERGEDIIELAKHFVNEIAQKQAISPPNISDTAIYYLLQYDWPGNVRQLKNSMLYAVNVCKDAIIKPQDLPDEIYNSINIATNNKISDNYNIDEREQNIPLKNIEKIMISNALTETGNNVTEAANLLGMSRSTLYRKIKQYDLLIK